MNIIILTDSGQPFDLGPHLTESARKVCEFVCLDQEAVEGHFAEFDAALAFGQRNLAHFYIARDDVSGGYVVFSHAA